MPAKPLIPLAGLLAAAVLVIPACGGDEADTRPAADSVPSEEVQGVERRVGELEKEIEKLRRDLEGVRNEQSSAEDAGDDTAATEPGQAGDEAQSDGATPGGSGAGGGSGPASGGGSGARPLGAGDEGGGPDPGTREDDPTVEDICGENPHPTC